MMKKGKIIQQSITNVYERERKKNRKKERKKKKTVCEQLCIPAQTCATIHYNLTSVTTGGYVMKQTNRLKTNKTNDYRYPG